MPRTAAHFNRPELRAGIWYISFTRNKEYHWRSTGIRADGSSDRNAGRARAEAARIVLEHDTGAAPCSLCTGGGSAAVDGTTLKDLNDAWVKKLRRGHPDRYVNRAITDMAHYVCPRWTHPAQITSTTWGEAVEHWHSTPTKRKKRLSYGSIANLANTMRAFLRFCLARGAIDSMPEIKSPTKKQKLNDRPRLSAMEEDQVERFLWALALMGEDRALLVYTTLFETWMRKGAIAAMTPRWVNFREESITIPSAFTKSQRGDKVIDLTPRAAEAVRHALGDPVKLDQPIFGKFDFHQSWRTRSGGVFGRALAMAGIDRLGLTPHHTTRRTAATIGGSRPGASLAGLMAQGGWDSATMPEVYMKPTLKAARAVTRRATGAA